MNVPFGATGTLAPLMVSVARPLPTVPKMKFESRTEIVWFAVGYAVEIASGPSTSGIAGSGGAWRGVIPRSNVAIVGGDAGGVLAGAGGVVVEGPEPDWQARASRQMAAMRVVRISRETSGVILSGVAAKDPCAPRRDPNERGPSRLRRSG